MKKIIVPIGIPGSGKSTYFASHFPRQYPGATILSSDEIRFELWWNYKNQESPEKVFGILFSRLDEALKNPDALIIIDATSKTKKDRKSIFDYAKRHWAEVQALFFNVHPEVALYRDSLRIEIEKDTWMEVIRRMFWKLEQPSFDEGFSSITILNDYDYDESINYQIQLISDLLSNRNTPDFAKNFFDITFEGRQTVWMSHDSEFHEEDVRQHLENVVNQAISRNVSNEVMLSTIFHDFGKYYVKSYNPKFERYTFEKHADVSVNMIDWFYLDKMKVALKEFNIDFDLMKAIVLNHNDYDRVYRKISKSNGWIENAYSFLWEYANSHKAFWDRYLYELYSQWVCDKHGAIKSTVLQDEVDWFENIVRDFVSKR